MALRLVTGPANSGRAGEVLDEYRARIAEDPILVVPGFRDVEHAQRELARTGAGLGARVVRFADLFRTIGERCGAPLARIASEVQREVLVEEAVRATRPRALAASAGRPGFTRAAVNFVAELERSMVEPGGLTRAIEQWGPRGARGARSREAAAIYAAYREGLDRAGLADEELAAWRSVDALREQPHRFGRTPVFAYGFDDFTPIELDALETLAERAEVDVVASLPYERGRAAFKAVAPLFERLSERASAVVEMPAVDEHYAGESRAALHHLERGLFEDAAGKADPGEAVRLLSAGGERAEVELVAARVLGLLRGGTPAGQVAVVYRDPGRYASVVEQVFGAYGIPYSLDRYVALGHTALGRGLLALLLCATREGRAEDVFAYMRTPGLLDEPALADRAEAEARQKGTRTVAQAREIWRARKWDLPAIDRLKRAASGSALLGELAAELDTLFAPSYRREGHIFADHELDDPRVWTEAHAAIAGLRELAEADPELELDAARVHDKLANLRVRLGEPFRPDRVQVADPEGIRARRFDAVFVCGLQEGEFPRPQGAEPFFSDDDRNSLARASDLRLPPREDELDRERHLFYVCCSRAERLLALSARMSDEEGNPQVQSFLVEEVKDLFAPLPVDSRTLADVTWPLEQAPTDAEWTRALALSGPRHEPEKPDGLHDAYVLGRLTERRLSAGALETFADCPVKWLVDRILRPEALEPDPEQLVRGSFAHAVLEKTYSRLGAAVTPANLQQAEELLLEELKSQQEHYRISPKETRFRTAVRRLEFDLLRHLRREAETGSEFAPGHLELGFGGANDELPPLRIGGEGVEITGRIDRVDVSGGRAVVQDYKTGKTTFPVASWEDRNRLQVALYMLAVRELLELEPVAGLYVALAGGKGPRGLVLEDSADGVGGVQRNDRKDAPEFEAQLARARERVGELAERMHAG
ncbi:MAG: hypothetical protein QOF37_2051, partial [Thermoleophilaceae bacterium]|nr:hypothetical protein [Thermoleophilaceae bacterium]